MPTIATPYKCLNMAKSMKKYTKILKTKPSYNNISHH